jgi:hypothetical protein
MAIILIPTPYRKHTGSHSRLDYPGHTVREILDSVESQYPGFSPCIMDEQHRVRYFGY